MEVQFSFIVLSVEPPPPHPLRQTCCGGRFGFHDGMHGRFCGMRLGRDLCKFPEVFVSRALVDPNFVEERLESPLRYLFKHFCRIKNEKKRLIAVHSTTSDYRGVHDTILTYRGCCPNPRRPPPARWSGRHGRAYTWDIFDGKHQND